MLNDILWPDHIQWQPHSDQTLYRTRTFTEFWEVSIEHLRRVWHACRQGTLTPPDTRSCPIWDLRLFFCWEHWHSIHYTTNSWPFTWFDLLNVTLLNIVSVGHQQRVWHADSGRLFFRAPGPVSLGLAYILLVGTNPSSELVVIFTDYALRISLGTFSFFLWLRITDEGSIPEMRIWSILLIK